MGGQVNVAVDASPSTDLNQAMTEIRNHYEGVISKNRKELESWYQNKVRGEDATVVYQVTFKGVNWSSNICDVVFVPRSQQWSRT